MDVSDLRHTIVPKSDQLNADQLLGGPMAITVTDVRLSSGSEQPVVVHYEGENGRPFKPCLTMRKVLILAWGEDGRRWVGKSMLLYNDPSVRWGKEEVGGVRISHLSDIPKDIHVSLAATKGKKVTHEIKRMEAPGLEALDSVKTAATVDALKAAFGAAYKGTRDPSARSALKAAYDRRMAELAPSDLLQYYLRKVEAAANADAAAQLLDEARSVLNPTEQAELNKAFAARFGDA